MPLIPTQSEPDEIALDVYYRLPGGDLVQYKVCSPIQPMEAAIEFCRKQVIETLPYKKHFNLAVLAVIPGGKV